MTTIWMLIILLAIIKLPLIALMMWLPFRDEIRKAREEEAVAESDGEDEGGSKTLPGDPRDPHPRRPLAGPPGPRRGPHGDPAPPSPPRTRTPLTGPQPQRIKT